MSHLKVHHCVGRDSVALAWVTPVFELYCVAGPTASRNALAHSANKVVQWVRNGEERIFIIGGAVSAKFMSQYLIEKIFTLVFRCSRRDGKHPTVVLRKI